MRLFCERIQELRRSQNRNAAEWVKHEEVLVAGHNTRGISMHCQIQKLVVLWVPACLEQSRGLDECRVAQKRDEELLPLLPGDVPVEPRPGEHLAQLCERRI